MYTRVIHRHHLPSRMYPCVSQQKSELDSNHPKHSGHKKNLHQLLKKKQQPYSAAKGEATKTTITAPPSIEEFHEQRR
jgi:hypothetical protein